MALDSPDENTVMRDGKRRIRASGTVSFSSESSEKFTNWLTLDGNYDITVWINNKLGNSVTVQGQSDSQEASQGIQGDHGQSKSVNANTSEPTLTYSDVMGSLRLGITPSAQSSGDVDVEILAVEK